MKEEEIIFKIKELKKIKPEKNWVLSTKKAILEEKKGVFFAFFPFNKGELLKWLSLGLTAGFVLVLTFSITKSFPKDNFPSLKFSHSKNIELAQITQLKKEVRAFTDKLEKIDLPKTETKTREKIAKDAKEITQKIKKLNQSLTVRDGGILEKEVEKLERISYKIECESLILDLEKRSLSEKQKKLFSEMKELAKRGEYQKALELWLENQ